MTYEPSYYILFLKKVIMFVLFKPYTELNRVKYFLYVYNTVNFTTIHLNYFISNLTKIIRILV